MSRTAGHSACGVFIILWVVRRFFVLNLLGLFYLLVFCSYLVLAKRVVFFLSMLELSYTKYRFSELVVIYTYQYPFPLPPPPGPGPYPAGQHSHELTYVLFPFVCCARRDMNE